MAVGAGVLELSYSKLKCRAGETIILTIETRFVLSPRYTSHEDYRRRYFLIPKIVSFEYLVYERTGLR